MIKNFAKLKNALLQYKGKKDLKSRIKKIIVWSFVLFIFIGIVVFLFSLYFYINWQIDKQQVLKQAEIYYNQILKETEVLTNYKSIGGKDYQLKNVEEPIKILDFKGELLGEFANEKRKFVNVDEVSPFFFYALFATEDSEFYSHNGVNFKAVMRAMFKNIISLKFVEGGSTLTQQLSKLLFTDRTRSLKRKVYEFFCARELEKIYTKEDLLLMYSNLIPFGHGAYGVETAAQLFLKKSAKDLDIGESAFLVSLISNPTRYSPFLNRKNSINKNKAVIDRMISIGYISRTGGEKEFNKFWIRYPFKQKDLNEAKHSIRSNYAPYVVEEARRFIVNSFGEDFFVKNRGAVVYTTIDKRLQILSGDILKKHINFLRTIASYKATREPKKIQGAVIFTVPDTGEIRVLLGGDEFTKDNQFNRAFQSKRQIGSSVKPFFYLSGINNKTLNPFMVFEDKPITLEFENAPEDQKYWRVSNYNDEYRGYLTVMEAIYRSSNVVTAQAAYLIGVDALKKVLADTLRIDIKEADVRFPSYQYSMALGAVELSPLELNTMYQMVANNGFSIQPTLITKITDNKSRVLYEAPTPISRRIVAKEPVHLLVNAMKRVFSAGGTASYIRGEYGIKFEAAGKTGTTQDHRDTWFNGFNNALLGTVWVGHDENESLGRDFTGGGVAAPIWAMIMKQASTFYDMKDFQADPGLKFIVQPVCLLSGKAAVKGKCKFIDEYAQFIEGTEPGSYCNLSEEEENKRALLKGWIHLEHGEGKIEEKSSGGF